MSDSLGDRIKRYERAYNQTLTPRIPVIVRVDGLAFHTYAKGVQRPSDYDLMCARSAPHAEPAESVSLEIA